MSITTDLFSLSREHYNEDKFYDPNNLYGYIKCGRYYKFGYRVDWPLIDLSRLFPPKTMTTADDYCSPKKIPYHIRHPPIHPLPGELIGARIYGNWKCLKEVEVRKRESAGTCAIIHAKSCRPKYIDYAWMTWDYVTMKKNYDSSVNYFPTRICYISNTWRNDREIAWTSNCQTNYYWEV
jgi:hypothetical protein